MATKTKAKHGGARPGSGRKPKLKGDARELFYMAVDKRWDLLIAKLDEFIENGDKDIIKMVIEQRIGKAPQTVDLGNKDDKPLEVKWM